MHPLHAANYLESLMIGTSAMLDVFKTWVVKLEVVTPAGLSCTAHMC